MEECRQLELDFCSTEPSGNNSYTVLSCVVLNHYVCVVVTYR